MFFSGTNLYVLTYLEIFFLIWLFIHFIAMIKIRVCHIVVVLLTYSCHNYLQTRSRQGLCMFSIEAGITQQEIVILNEFHSFYWLTGVMFARDFGAITLGWRNFKTVFSFGNAVISLLRSKRLKRMNATNRRRTIP